MISPQAYALAKRYLQGVPPEQMMGALGKVVSSNPDVPLMQLITAHNLLKEEEKKQKSMQAMYQAQQGAGTPGQPPQQETVAQQVANRLAALEQEGGIAELPTGHLGENYATGGIVAFDGTQGSLVGDTPFFSTPGYAPYQMAGPRPRTFDEEFPIRPRSPQMRALEAIDNPPASTDITSNLGDVNKYTPAPVDTPYAVLPTPASTPAAKPGLPSVTPTARAATAAQPSMPDFLSPEERAFRDKRLAEATAAKPMAEKSREEIGAEMEANRKAALKAKGLPEDAYKERVDQLASEAKQAKEDRDTDRWLSLAQGFFAMGAAKSPYALQNMAEGLGVTTKQLSEVEKEYRKAEKARLDSIAALKQAQRAEALGLEDKKDEMTAKHIALVEKSKEHMDTVNGKLLASITGAQTTRAHYAAAEKGAEATRGQTAEIARARLEAGKEREEERKRANTEKELDTRLKMITEMEAKLAEKHPAAIQVQSYAALKDAAARQKMLATNPMLRDYIEKASQLSNMKQQLIEKVYGGVGGSADVVPTPAAPTGPRQKPLAAFGG